MFEKITFFDTEFANSKNRSICQLALICDKLVDGEVVRTERSYLVNPEDNFQAYCQDVHGITEEQVENAPAFPELWPEIAPFFEDTIVVGHNAAAADLYTLAKNCARYEIAMPEIRYVDTIHLAKAFCAERPRDFKLSTLCSFFDINPGHSHDALCDTRSCAELFYLFKEKFEENIQDFGCLVSFYYPPKMVCFEEYKEHPGRHNYVDTDSHPDRKGMCPFPQEILSHTVPFDGIMEGKSFCLTGDFAYGKRKEVEQLISGRGGKVLPCAKKSMDYLLIGTFCSPNYAAGHFGNKMEETLAFQIRGALIKIITEADFFAALNCGCGR